MSALSEAVGLLPQRPPRVGELVEVRSRRWLVEAVEAADQSASPRVSLACADDDAQGQTLEVYWDFEIDRRILEREAWSAIGARGFDPPRHFGAFLHGEPEILPRFPEPGARRIERGVEVVHDSLTPATP